MADTPTLPLTGGCGCGAVRFAIDAPLVGAAYCHCTRCQHRTGTAAAASATVVPGSVRILQGAEDLHGWAPPGGLEKLFCATCGSHLLARDPETEEIAVVRLGAFDEDPGVRPALHQYTAYAVPWEPLPDDGLPRYPERRPG